MASSSTASAAASNLTRPRTAVVAAVSAVVLASLGYQLYTHYYYSTTAYLADDTAGHASELHRSNAIRRRRRSSQPRDDSSGSDSHGDENAADATLAALMDASVPLPEYRPQAEDQPPPEWYNDPSQAPRQRTGENIVTLLFKVSEDNARRNANVHRGCQCNGCGMVPIRGIRYRCANCPDFDLCEVCESQGVHFKTHVFYKVRVPAPPFGQRQIQPSWYPGDPETAHRNLPRWLLSKWSTETGFDRVELEALWEQWTFMANTEWRNDPNNLGLAMDRRNFERCLVPNGGYRHNPPNLIHDRMFAFYDTNNDDLIGFEEFLHGVAYKKKKDKLRKTFEGYDVDGDGFIDRRDCLRMFRAYYVLYKQMHRDILEGLDDHMMTTLENQQLVNSRQPVSSQFGREGRVPSADHDRGHDGKIFRSNQDAEIHDGKAVVSSDKPDTSSREDILRDLFTRNSNQGLFTESFASSSRRPQSSTQDARYISALLNPPRNSTELTSLIDNDLTQLDNLIDSMRRQEIAADEPDTDSYYDEEQSTPDEAGDADEADEDREVARPSANGNEDPSTSSIIPDARSFINTLPVEIQLLPQPDTQAVAPQRLTLDKRKRVIARRQLFERWKRRQFYLDEEEGGLPPQGWRDELDVLANTNSIAEPSKLPQPILSPRSRSSSKVRFAEDTDEFETRSNHSTSSRSVPERWGGMEIPDAERDAGREILYQVTQQAYNELLDELFKKKEDLAVEAAETNEQREKYRVILDQLELDDEDEKSETDSRDDSETRGKRKNTPAAHQSLQELLATSGYTIHLPEIDTEKPQAQQDKENEQTSEEAISTPSASTPEYRDPTMPQFKPQNLAPSAVAPMVSSNSIQLSKKPDITEDVPDHATFMKWKRIDLAEQEARDRGGWGRLNYDEFNEIYRQHEMIDGHKNRLAYLSSWIDFCIP
ncbi:EF-hand [Xylariaceae sp. FL0255]|nr:EF-hand [Xylariaceae sp. FL0255]